MISNDIKAGLGQINPRDEPSDKENSNLVPRACDPLGRKRRLWDNP